MPRIPLPQRQYGILRGIHGTTYGIVLKVRLSKHGHNKLKEAAIKLDMPMSQFMRQVIESAAEEVCNDQGSCTPDSGD